MNNCPGSGLACTTVSGSRVIGATTGAGGSCTGTTVAPITRLPETVVQGTPDPGQLFIRLGTFHTYAYANIQRARVAGLGADIVSTREGRTRTHRVIIGPLATVQEADMVLDQVLQSGVTEARIVVE